MKNSMNDINPEKYIMYREYYRILEQWLTNIQNEKKVASYFKYHNYNKIAVYGFGRLAKHLIHELNDSDIAIQYVIDKQLIQSDIEVYSDSDKEYPDVDVLIVTPVYAFEEIEKKMCTYMDVPIVPLQEVINEVASI